MYDEHDSKMIFADLVSRDNAFEGYYDNLGIMEKIYKARDDWATFYNLRKDINIVDGLIKAYKLSGNDLNDEIPFRKLKADVDLIFKPKGFFSFFK